MNPVKIFIPLFAIIALAITAPAWSHWLGMLGNNPPHVQFLAGILLPFVVLLLGASWLEPRRDS